MKRRYIIGMLSVVISTALLCTACGQQTETAPNNAGSSATTQEQGSAQQNEPIQTYVEQHNERTDKGNIDNVTVQIGRIAEGPVLYKDEEIHAAMDVVKDYFHGYMTGCTLLELQYNPDDNNKDEKPVQENGKDVMILNSSFQVDENGGDGSFSPNEKVTDWTWSLVKTDGKWVIQNYGWG